MSDVADLLFKNPSAQPVSIDSPKPVKFEDFEEEFDPNSGWSVLLYGKSGAGKTWWSGTARDSLYINTGSGFDTLISPLFLAKYPNIKRKKIDIIDTKDRLGFDQICDAVDLFLINKELRAFVKTIILDDATELRALAVNHALRDAGKDITKFNVVDGMDAARYEKNRLDWFLTRYMPVFKKERIHFVMLAHEARIYGTARKKGDERELREIRPGFAGEKHVDYIPAKFEEVWYIEKKESKGLEFSQIKTSGGGIELTKTRRAGVFKKMEIGMDFEQLLQKRKENKLDPQFLR